MSTHQPDLSEFNGTDEDEEGEPCPTCGDEFDAVMPMKVHHTRAHGESLNQRECPECGDEFVPQSGTSEQEYCSRQCYGKARRHERATLTCPECGEDFETVEPERRTYCSRECLDASMQPDPEDLVRECEACGAGFRVESTTSSQRYCSNDCRYSDRRERVTLSCEECGDDYEVVPSKVERSRYCSAECRHTALETHRTKTCEVCGADFEPGESTQQYCSHECANVAKRERVTLSCAHCGDEFDVKPARADEARYCSLDCHYESSRKRVTRECAHCGDAFESEPWRDRQYCSEACVHAGQRRRTTHTCRYCGGTFETQASVDRDYCSRVCYLESYRTRPRLLQQPYLGLIETLHELFVVEDRSISDTARRIPDHGYDWVRSRLIEFDFYDPDTDVPLARRLEQSDPEDIGLDDPGPGDSSYKQYYNR